MKRTNSFVLFERAFKNAKNDFWVSIQVLLVATFVLALLFYFVEHMAQPEEYKNPWDAFVWAITRYIGDPGHFAGKGPVTLTGRYIDTIIGILKILIFAVPAGLVANGFRQAMEDDKKLQRMESLSVTIHKYFRRSAQSNSWFYTEKNFKKCYKGVDRTRKLTSLQIKLGLSMDRILETINYCPDLRLANLASTQRRTDNPQDSLVVVNFPLNNEYGCFLDRESDVTIVVPTALNEIGTGNAAFSLSAMGGFNYVSRELTPNQEDSFSFYTMDKENLALMNDYDEKEDVESQALHFMDDLNKLKKKSEERGKKHWFIFVLGTLRTEKSQVHLWRLATDSKEKISYRIDGARCKYGSTVLQEDEEKLQNMFHDIQDALGKREITVQGEKQSIVSGLDDCDIWKSVTEQNIMRRMNGGVDCNTLTMRIGYEILYYSTIHLLIMKDIADAIKKQLEPEREIPVEAKKCFLEDGDGFADNYGEEKVFLHSPQALNTMISKANKLTRTRFEHLDLDGNELSDYNEHHQQPKWKRIVGLK